MSWCKVPNPEWSWSNFTVPTCICRSGFPADNGDCEVSGGTWHSGDGWGCETCLMDDRNTLERWICVGLTSGLPCSASGAGQGADECCCYGEALFGGEELSGWSGTMYESMQDCEISCPGSWLSCSDGGGGGQDHWECNFMGGGGCVKSPTGTYGSQESCELDCPGDGGGGGGGSTGGENKFGDLSCGCDKYLIGQISSLSMGPIMTEFGAFPCQPVNENGATVYKCGVLGKKRIQKGKTYVVKVSTAGLDKFDHSNHWWQVDFEKCEVKEETLETRIDAAIESSLVANGIPNAMFAMTIDGDIAYSNYYSNLGAGGDDLSKEPIAMTASIAKSVCGAAIGTLYDSGKLSPDSRLVDILSEYFYDSSGNRLFVDSRYETITVAHLVDMQAGWNRAYAPDVPWGTDDILFMDTYIATDLCKMFPDQYPDGIKLPIELKHIVQWENQRYLDFDPGTGGAAGWEGYSNYGYCLLAEIIGRVSGQRYDAYVKSAILDPLGIDFHFRGPYDREDTGPNPHPDMWRIPDYPSVPAVSSWDGWCYADGCTDLIETTLPYYVGITRYGYGSLLVSATAFVKFLTLFEYTAKSNAILSADTKNFMFSRKAWHGNEWEYYAYGQLTRDGMGEAGHGGFLPSAETAFYRWMGVNPNTSCGPVNWVLFINPRHTPPAFDSVIGLVEGGLYSTLESILQDPSVISPAFDISTDYALNDDCTPAPPPGEKKYYCRVTLPAEGGSHRECTEESTGGKAYDTFNECSEALLVMAMTGVDGCSEDD